ncbi:MAG: anti-sigma factor, partial [Hyphomicrobiaceae bacterium]
LESEQRQRFEARLPTEPALVDALMRARERFLEIDTSARPMMPSAGLWQSIEKDLDAPSNVVDLNGRRDAKEVQRAASPQSWSGFWRGFAAASLVAMTLAGAAVTALWPQPPRLVIVLLDDNARPVSIVESYAGQKIRVVPLGSIEVPAGRTLQVWTLPDPATGPVSMGLLPGVTAATLEGPPLPNPKLDQLYEITLEPSGGSPTGKPTGPIIGKGYARRPQI